MERRKRVSDTNSAEMEIWAVNARAYTDWVFFCLFGLFGFFTCYTLMWKDEET